MRDEDAENPAVSQGISQKSVRSLAARAFGAHQGEEGTGGGQRLPPAPSSPERLALRAVLGEKTTFETP